MRLTSFAAAFVICAVAVGAEEPSERHRLAENLLDAMDMGTQITASFDAMTAVIPAQLKQMQALVPADAKGGKPGVGAEQQKEMMEKNMEMCAEEMKWEKIKPDYIDLYAETFSAEELKELIAFYQSPAGKVFMAKQPELMQKSMQLSQKTMMRLMPKIMAMSAEVAAEAAKEKADKPVESSDRDGQSAEEQLLASSETLRSLLMTPDIQQKLLLSAKQIAAINAAVIPPKSSIVPLAEAMEPFAPILVDWQIRALMPHVITSNGVRAFGTPEVQESLQLSHEQKMAIGAVLAKRRSDIEAVENTEFSMKFLREVLDPLDDKAYDDVVALLTADQRKTWESISEPRLKRRGR